MLKIADEKEPNETVDVPPVVPVNVTETDDNTVLCETEPPLTFAIVLIDQDGPAS